MLKYLFKNNIYIIYIEMISIYFKCANKVQTLGEGTNFEFIY